MILHLVRHARPDIRPGRAPSTWQLAPDAETEVRRLRASDVLPPSARWVSSTEPKALATARLLTDRPVWPSDALCEMRRGRDLVPDDEFAAAVRASMLAPDRSSRPGWESATATLRRVRAAVDQHVRDTDEGNLVLVGHGTAWTLLFAALTGTPPDVTAWENLRMPDHCAISIELPGPTATRVLSPWGAWANRH